MTSSSTMDSADNRIALPRPTEILLMTPSGIVTRASSNITIVGRSDTLPVTALDPSEAVYDDFFLYAGITTENSFMFRDPHRHNYDGASPTGNLVGNNVWNPVSRRQPSGGVCW